MNKTELIDAIAAAADLPKASAGRALDAVVDNITDALTKGDQVSLVGFGTFSVKHQPADRGDDRDSGIERAQLQGRQGAERRCQFLIAAHCRRGARRRAPDRRRRTFPCAFFLVFES